MERGVPIRSISRCIAVLQAINRHGSLSLMEIARSSKLPYPTSCRIIQTLMHEGLVECEPTRKYYRATGLVHALSEGFRNQDALVTRARPFIAALTCKFGWPVAITTRIGRSMMIRDTTHDLTALTYKLYPPGSTMPLLECASGRAYFAHLEAGERARAVEDLEHHEPDSPSLSLFKTEATIARIRDDGFAVYDRGPQAASPGRTSAIGVPLLDGGQPAGALALIFFSSSMGMAEALEAFLPDLKATAGSISEAIGSLRTDAVEKKGRPQWRAPSPHAAPLSV